jgi:hypothetical protein
MKWNQLLGALMLCAGMCSPSYGFEWLDRLLGIDLDNSQGTGIGSAYSAYPNSAGYPNGASNYGYTTGYSSGYSQHSAGYTPYSTNYAPHRGEYHVAPYYAAAPQTGYRNVYQSAPVTRHQPVVTVDQYGNRTTTMRPVVTYPRQSQGVAYPGNQPVYIPAAGR